MDNCKDTKTGFEYDGDTNVTKSGKVCRSWSEQIPQVKESDFPEKDFNRIGNKCRNPGGKQSPWCFISDRKKKFDYCNILKCKKKINQAEYFREDDMLSLAGEFLVEFKMGKLIKSITVTITVRKDLWTDNVQKTISVWATAYSSRCQRDLRYYEYCQSHRIMVNKNSTIITFKCKNPLLSLIIITPLENHQYSYQLQRGQRYIINNSLDSKVRHYLTKARINPNTEMPSIKLEGNCSPFYLLSYNVIPYAVTKDNKPVMTISKVGKGNIGLMGTDTFLDQKFRSQLKNYFLQVYGDNKRDPISLTNTYFHNLKLQWKSGKAFKDSVIWNAHQKLGKENITSLLNMVHYGLNLVVGLKPWAYYYYVDKFPESEIIQLFLAAGVWPSTDVIEEDLRIVTSGEKTILSLMPIMDYARVNKTSLISVGPTLTESLTNIPFEIFSESPTGTFIFKELKAKLSELFYTYSHLMKSLVPCLRKAVTSASDKVLLGIFNSMLLSRLNTKFTAPGINFYPGRIDRKSVKTETVRLRLKMKFQDENVYMGLYLPASERTVVSLTTLKSKECTLYVNFHLFDTKHLDKWEKWPRTTSSYTIAGNSTRSFTSSFGGLLSISCQTKNDNVMINLSNIVQIAMYDRRNGHACNNWHNLKKRKAPWSILASDTTVFLVPSIAVRNMEDPEPVMEMWDRITKEEFHLRGRSVAEIRREIICADIQIKAGYMHAGYPIGAFIQSIANPAKREDFLFASEYIRKKGSWGIFHELGHNLQHNIFTFDGTEEVTNNIFTMVATESVSGISSWNESHSWVSDEKLQDMISYLKNKNFSFWQKEPFIALGVYAQLRSEFGWEFYRQLFRRYDMLIMNIGERVETMSTDERIQLWVFESSRIVMMNLVPLYDFWGWPISETTKKRLGNSSQYPLFFPDDFLTRMIPDKVDEIISKYEVDVSVKRTPVKVKDIVGPLMHPVGIEGYPVIEEMTIL